MSCFTDILTFLGFAALCGMITLIIIIAFEFIRDAIHNWKRTYEYKHRFGVKPIAKCYCFDCKWHDNKTSQCFRFHEKDGRLTGDTYFCHEAEPRK